jgi:hypothetical protein
MKTKELVARLLEMSQDEDVVVQHFVLGETRLLDVSGVHPAAEMGCHEPYKYRTLGTTVIFAPYEVLDVTPKEEPK